jgi:hypothetical protein
MAKNRKTRFADATTAEGRVKDAAAHAQRVIVSGQLTNQIHEIVLTQYMQFCLKRLFI